MTEPTDSSSEFLLYTAPDDEVRVDVLLHEEAVPAALVARGKGDDQPARPDPQTSVHPSCNSLW